MGGELLTIETATMQGKGELVFTGSLGDVMKESIRAAMSVVRAGGERFGISYDKFKDTDIHVHMPEGATPKDGPSAGIALTTALVSAFTGIAIRADIAMTGEVTLRGKVLKIGGLKKNCLPHIVAVSITCLSPSPTNLTLPTFLATSKKA